MTDLQKALLHWSSMQTALNLGFIIFLMRQHDKNNKRKK